MAPTQALLLLAATSLLPSALGLHPPQKRFSFADLNSSSSCSNPQLSCHNTTAVSNLCCFNSPGGTLLQVQFWDTDPAEGPDNSWTIHGLWPDNCNGGYSSNCDPSRAYTNITAILQEYNKTALLQYMNEYWISDDSTNESFWEHEWAKHGTCVSTLDPSCFSNYQPGEEVPYFFQTVVNVFQTLPTYTWLQDAGITPSTSKTYSLSAIQSALSSKHGNQVYIECSDNALSSVYYYFNVRGSLQSGTFVSAPVQGSDTDCPSTGIKYPPK